MARSILPSRWRGAAATRALHQRSARRTARMSLTAVARDPDSWDECWDWDLDARREIGVFVRGRRGADKLHHFERWATRVTEALPREDRLGRIRALLPDGVIGRHAISHAERWDAFRAPHELHRRWWGLPRRRVFLDRGEHAELLRELLSLGDGHRQLNRALEFAMFTPGAQGWVSAVPSAARRKLLGLDDVLPFLEALETSERAPLKTAMDSFCRRFKESRR